MYDHDVIEESGDYRVRLEYSHREEFPDFVQSTVIPTNDRYHSYNDHHGLAAIVQREWSWRRAETIERWLRIFHGVQAVAQVDTRDCTYLILLTEEAQSYYGTPDDGVQECVDGDAETFRQWVEGEVYGYVVERKMVWTPIEVGGYAVEPDGEVRMETWEEVDSLWDMFGREYAEGEAREALASEAAA